MRVARLRRDGVLRTLMRNRSAERGVYAQVSVLGRIDAGADVAAA